MPQNAENCSLINQPCTNSFLCGTCPVARKALLEAPDFKDIKNIQVTPFSSSNRTALLSTPDTDPQGKAVKQIVASVSKGVYQKNITPSELKRLKKRS
jgi:hypothetical protein